MYHFLNFIEIEFLEFMVGRLFDDIYTLRSPMGNKVVANDILDSIISRSEQITEKAKKMKAELNPQEKREPGVWKLEQVFLDNENSGLDPEAFGGEDYPST